MPAESDMGFAIASLRVVVCCERRDNVSEIVEAEELARASTRASIAATGIVISGSEARRRR